MFQSFYDTITNVYNNINFNSNQRESIAKSVYETYTSGKDIKWYYNPEKGTYTWRQDGSSPPKGYTSISGNNKKGNK
jgi:hypothetical protein